MLVLVLIVFGLVVLVLVVLVLKAVQVVALTVAEKMEHETDEIAGAAAKVVVDILVDKTVDIFAADKVDLDNLPAVA